MLKTTIKSTDNSIRYQYTDQSSDCRSIESLSIHPLECCTYPIFYDNPPSTSNMCATKCKNDVRFPNFSCQRTCIIKETGVFEDGTVKSEGFLKLFFEGGEKELKELSPRWQDVVRNSIRSCEDEFPAKWIEDDNKCRSFYGNFVECVRKMNFLNCVDYKGNDKCAKMKELMENCFMKNYDFLHKVFFEDFYFKGKNG